MRIFAAQFVTLLVNALGVGGLAGILFWGLRLGRALRVSVEVEAVGVHIPKHGGATYRPHAHAQLVMTRVHVPRRTDSLMDDRWVHRVP